MAFAMNISMERKLISSSQYVGHSRIASRPRVTGQRVPPGVAQSIKTSTFVPTISTKTHLLETSLKAVKTTATKPLAFEGAEVSYAIPISDKSSEKFDQMLRESYFKVSQTDKPEVPGVEMMKRVMECVPHLTESLTFEDSELEYLRERYVSKDGKMRYLAFQELAMRVFWLSNKEKEFKHAFMLADADNDGVLREREISLLLKDLGHPASPEEVQRLVEEADCNDNGVIEYREFVLMACSGTLDVAEVLAFRAIGSGPTRVGMPKSMRRKHAVMQMRTLMTQQWAEQYQIEEEKTPAAVTDVKPAVEAAPPPPPPPVPIQVPRQPGEPVSLEAGCVNMIHSSEDLRAVLQNNPDKPAVLMVGFTFCRPCKAFKRTYEKMAAYYPEVMFLFVYGNQSENTKHLVKSVLKLKVSPMFYLFRGYNEDLEPFSSHSGARDYKLVDAFLPFLKESEIPEDGHYPTSTRVTKGVANR